MENVGHFSTFVLAIDRISKNIKRIKDKEMESFGLKSSHVILLFNIAKHEGGLNSKQLSEVCGVDKSFISRTTQELEQKDYITRDKNSNGNIYKCKFILTEKGMHVTSVIYEKISGVVKKVAGNIPDHKKRIFYEILEIFDENISDVVKEIKE
ncbi:MAG: MarR family transcriptional regulator [Clostridia bacterium]|nr:MarR family transcriptional regulator [Clostridia bacterium]